ncbi:kinase RLK-Pelle-WAK family protein, partial [Tanacetum coccineum]
MRLLQAYHILLVIFLSLTTTSVAVSHYAKQGCNDMCGKVSIPYPFGIGAKCSVNKWYIVDCNSSTPYLSAVDHLEVLAIGLQNQVVTVNIILQNYSDCSESTKSVDLGKSPFLFSRSQNTFGVRGCGYTFGMNEHGNVLIGCSSTCSNDTTTDTTSYTLNLTGLQTHGVCGGSVHLVDKMTYFQGSHLSRQSSEGSSNPIQYHYCGTCQRMTTIKCARCKHNGGACDYDPIHDVNGAFNKWNFTCYHRDFLGTSSYLDVTLGVSISMGVLFLVTITYILYKVIKRAKERRRRKKFFKLNGGLLLKQQEANQSLVDKTILFTSRELEKATDNFDENRVLGRGGQGTVYKGMLVDGRIVAVKKSKIVDESQLEQFTNEVPILSQVNQRNVVKVLRCCLETDVPLLVSEFIPNGTLYNRIHNETDEDPMSLNMRQKVATEVAGALAYLHSATSIPIYHRDIKTTIILLDDKYRAKVSDFGTSRFVSIDQTHLTTLVIGTFGYLDPEYFQSSQFTEKSDVYSFGVVLVELITGERPISLTRFGENRSLAAHFMLAVEEGRV